MGSFHRGHLSLMWRRGLLTGPCARTTLLGRTGPAALHTSRSPAAPAAGNPRQAIPASPARLRLGDIPPAGPVLDEREEEATSLRTAWEGGRHRPAAQRAGAPVPATSAAGSRYAAADCLRPPIRPSPPVQAARPGQCGWDVRPRRARSVSCQKGASFRSRQHRAVCGVIPGEPAPGWHSGRCGPGSIR